MTELFRKPVIQAFALVLLAIAAASCSNDTASTDTGSNGAPPSAGPVEVGVVTLKTENTPKLTQLPGRVVALATAEVRPQVSGIIQEISFREGSRVKAGDILYRLDSKSYEVARDASAATVKKAQATVAAAQAAFNRTQRLVDSQTASVQTLDEARSTLLQAQADEQAALANLKAAEINLGYTEIAAPISGVIGKSDVSVGSLVTANQTGALATIRQIQPIHVDLVDSSANLLEIRDQIERGRLGIARANGRPTPPKVSLVLETGRAYDETGEISASDTAVSESTGTFSIRATFPNAERTLLPGMYVRATVDLGTINNVLLVPQRAVGRDASGKAQVYVVTAGNKVEPRSIETDGSTATAWIVTGGLAAGDRVIVDGQQRISAGVEARPVEVTVNELGVVEQSLSAPQSGGGGGAANGTPAQ